MGALLYLPEAWTTDPARRAAARIPTAVRFQEKWRLALTLRAANAGGRDHADRGRRGRRVRRQQHRPPNAASSAPAVCLGHLADPDDVSRHARHCASIASNRRRAIVARAGPIRTASASARSAMRLPGTRLAARHVAQWHQSAVGGRLRRDARHAGHRLAPATARPRGLAAVRARARARRAAARHYFGLAARIGVAHAVRPAGASPLGDRTALSGSQDRTGARPLRRAHLSGLAAPHGDQRRRVCLSPARTDAATRRDRRSPFRRPAPSSRKSLRGCCLSVARDTCSG